MTVSLENMLSNLESKGFRGSIASIRRLEDLRREIESRRRKTGFDPGLERDYLSAFAFSPPARLPNARSLLAVAAPVPQVEITFHRNGKPVRLRVPPTYLHDSDAAVERAIHEVLSPSGYSLAKANVPEKLLAVRSGLAEYGKNNVAYVLGMGSFHRLTAFFSDFPCETEWFLAGRAAGDDLPAATRKKLEELYMMEYKNILDRNLGVLMNRD